ncbi:hypothetical protein BDW59DRAFT_145210 [Aspergillus cavernicola]|uniref:Uncharacterized protein n=1 Tax=Aspergillus cavernicola TaxID=176166 RepID=A0ABR4IFB8_9EURO
MDSLDRDPAMLYLGNSHGLSLHTPIGNSHTVMACRRCVWKLRTFRALGQSNLDKRIYVANP